MMSDKYKARPLPLGTETIWGKIQSVGVTGGERYYWMVAQDGSVAMMPAFVIEGGKNAGNIKGRI